MSAGRNVLIVYAHQEPKSFNGALKDLAEKTLTAQGHTVKVSDLYAMSFDPRASRGQFKEENLQNPDYFRFDKELGHAAKTETLPEAVKAELDQLLWADLVILQTPLYWMGLPAILKGWTEWCLAETVAYDRATYQQFDNGPFKLVKKASESWLNISVDNTVLKKSRCYNVWSKGDNQDDYMNIGTNSTAKITVFLARSKEKKLLLSLTTGGGEAFYTERGMFGDISVALWPILFGLWNTGVQLLPVQVSYSPGVVSPEVRKGYLETLEARLKSIFEEKPIQFVSVQHFDPKAGFSLTPEYLKSIEKDKCAPTVGQHMGRPIQPDSLVYKKNT